MSLSGSTWRTRWWPPRPMPSVQRPQTMRRPPLVLRRLPSRPPVPKRSRPRLLRPRLAEAMVARQGLSCHQRPIECANDRGAEPSTCQGGEDGSALWVCALPVQITPRPRPARARGGMCTVCGALAIHIFKFQANFYICRHPHLYANYAQF